MSLRIIGAGLGRTGTMSLKMALEELLGAPCYHMATVRDRPDDPDIWGDAYEGRLPDWHQVFDGFRAVVDWPAAPFWQELSEAFPDAPILLSTRDADAWWKSVSETIFIALETYTKPDAPDDGWTRMGRGMLSRFSPDWQNESAAKGAFLAYNDYVRATAPRHRLLEWSPGDGWEPICAALEVDVPDHQFPHVNTTAETRAAIGLEPL